MRALLDGARFLQRGFGWWRVHPKLMALGLVPALVVGAAWGAILVVLFVRLGSIVAWMTQFATGLPPVLQTAIELAAGAAILAAALGVMVSTFTAVALVVGEPVYDRIWRSVEQGADQSPPDSTFWASVRSSLQLIAMSLAAGVVSFAVGFIPFLGAPLSAVLGVTLQSYVLGRELVSRALLPRGATIAAAGRLRTFGFGLATYLVMLIPLAAIAVMPAAVAGASLLAHRLLGIRAPG